MSATIFEILEILDPQGQPDENSFVLGASVEVSAQVIADQKTWSLYSIDLPQNLAWFVELPLGLDLAKSAFVYLDQHRTARRLLRVSLDEMDEVAQHCPMPERVIFAFNTGRCGSTLVSHALNFCPGVWCLSEPTVFPRLIRRNFGAKARLDYPREKTVRLIRSLIRLLFRPPTGAGHDVFAIKFHSQCLLQADLYREALPEASFVFLYRDAMGWTKSVYQMVLKYGIKPRLTGEDKTLIWNVLSSCEDESYLRPYVDLDAETLPLEDSIVISWAWYVEEYNRQLAAGVPFLALRYNELNRDREASLRHLFSHCGLPVQDVIGGLAAFEADSQAGTLLARSDTAERMSDDQVARARSLLARHPREGNPDRRLADIYSTVP
jgi:hypothetical protein